MPWKWNYRKLWPPCELWELNLSPLQALLASEPSTPLYAQLYVGGGDPNSLAQLCPLIYIPSSQKSILNADLKAVAVTEGDSLK